MKDFVEYFHDICPQNGHSGKLLNNAQSDNDEERLVNLRMCLQVTDVIRLFGDAILAQDFQILLNYFHLFSHAVVWPVKFVQSFVSFNSSEIKGDF